MRELGDDDLGEFAFGVVKAACSAAKDEVWEGFRVGFIDDDEAGGVLGGPGGEVGGIEALDVAACFEDEAVFLITHHGEGAGGPVGEVAGELVE